MKLHTPRVPIFVALTIFRLSAASDTGTGTLNVSLEPGPLEIASQSRVIVETNIDSAPYANGKLRKDFVTFVVEEILVNDLNGDGTGWTLAAYPEALRLQSNAATHELPIGTIDGFQNASHAEKTEIESTNRLTFNDGNGVVEFTIDYQISYDLPSFSPPGLYRGEIRFELNAL